MGTTRPITQAGEAPIPWTSIDAFATRAEISGEAFHRFLRIMRAVDSRYMQVRQGQQAEARERQKLLDEEAAANAGEETAKRLAAQMARKKQGQD